VSQNFAGSSRIRGGRAEIPRNGWGAKGSPKKKRKGKKGCSPVAGDDRGEGARHLAIEIRRSEVGRKHEMGEGRGKKPIVFGKWTVTGPPARERKVHLACLFAVS